MDLPESWKWFDHDRLAANLKMAVDKKWCEDAIAQAVAWLFKNARVVAEPSGAVTTAAVALQHGRQYLGCELNPEYMPLQQDRIDEHRNLFNAA